MFSLKKIKLKKNEERRIKAGHVWIYSNEIDTSSYPLKSYQSGELVIVEASDGSFLGYGYINPHSLISVRLLSKNKDVPVDDHFFSNKISQALSYRDALYKEPFYRLIFGESDELAGLIVDRFDKHLVVQLNTAGMEVQRDTIVKALLKVLPETQSILLKNDSSSRIQEGLDKKVEAGYGQSPEITTVYENETEFQVPLWKGQKTGWFYDHRYNRQNIIKYIKNKRVLDLFSYLGAWGIQTVKHGAKEAVCLDISATACDHILENAKLNGLEDKITVICNDAFDALRDLHQSNEQFDVIVLDPPAFVKKQKDLKEGLVAYQRLNELALKLLVPEGVLISCSCSMHVSYSDLVQSIRKASLKNNYAIQIIERGHQSQDHPVHIAIPETDYLKMIIVRKMS